jgi:hypothetical protein
MVGLRMMRGYCGRCGVEIEKPDGGAWRHIRLDPTHVPVLGVPAGFYRSYMKSYGIEDGDPIPPYVKSDFDGGAVNYPEPEVPARAAEPGEVPLTGSSLLRLAGQHGWDVEVTFSRGTLMAGDGSPAERTARTSVLDEETGLPALTAKGNPRHTVTKTGDLVVVDSIVARFRKGGGRVVMTWYDGKLDNSWGYRTAAGRRKNLWSALTIDQVRATLKGERE